MRTHTRYELQDSTSIEEGPNDEGTESPHPGSLGSGAGPSRSISSESADINPRQQQPVKPPSPMDTEMDGISGNKRLERSCTS